MSLTQKVPRTTTVVVSFVAVLALLGSLGGALVVVQPAGAATSTLFVSASGSDTNPCTATAPCATVSHAFSLSPSSGTTIEVAGHIFDAVTIFTGITRVTITIKHWPGQAPAVIDGRGHATYETIQNEGILTLDHLTVAGGDGGVANSNTLTISHSTIRGNTAIGIPSTYVGGGVDNYYGTLTITHSTITGNTASGTSAGVGGGVLNLGGFLTVTDSTITGNKATGTSSCLCGGGVLNYGQAAITDSTIAGNAASVSGTAFVVGGGVDDEGATNITDSTITGNKASASGSGSGIYVAVGGGVGGVAANITDSTITGNTATGPNSGGGVESLEDSFVGATIVSGNTGAGAVINDCVGIITGVGYNLTDDTTGTACGFTQTTDKVDVNPDLGPLAFNGGPTETLLPALNSPAVGAIPDPTTLNGVPVCRPGAFDQRGMPRPSPGPNCTIGAVERRG